MAPKTSALGICGVAVFLALVAVPATAPCQLAAQEQANAELSPQQLAMMQSDAVHQLMRIGIALHEYHSDKKSFPAAFISDGDGKPLLSWRVEILPYLDDNEKALYQEFDLAEPWDSAKNKPLIEKIPEVFRCPASRSPAGTTIYQTPRGASTAFPGAEGVGIRKITDGTSNTIAVVEVIEELAVPWTKPVDCNLNLAMPSGNLGGHFKGGFLAEFCDGSCHFLPNMIKPEVLNALFTRASGEIVVVPN
jgi:hypothetical protein